MTYRFRTVLITVLLMACILAFSWVLFIHQSIRLDEAQTLWQVNRPPAGILHVVASDVHVPLYHFMNYTWDIFFGNGVIANRMLSVTIYMIGVPFVMLLAYETYRSWKISIFTGVLFTISPFMNWYANEIRMYSLLTLIAVINQIYFLRIRRDNKPGSWWGYAITSIIGAYVHYFFGLVIFTQIIFFLLYPGIFPKQSFKKLLGIWLLVLASLGPWVLFVIRLGLISNSEPMLPVPTLINIFNTISEFLVGNQSTPINAFVVGLWPLMMLAWFFSLPKNKQQRSYENIFLGLTVVIPIAIAFLVSIIYKPVYLERYLIFTLPAFYMLLSAMILSYSPRISRILQIVTIIAMIAALVVEAENPATPTKENYQAAANYLSQYATPQDVIVTSAPFTIYPLEYAYQGPTKIETLPLWNQSIVGAIPAFNSSTLPSEVQQIAGSHDRLWLLLSYDQGYQNDIQTYFDDHYRELGKYQLSPGMTLIVYQLRYDIPLIGSVPQETSSTMQ